MKALLDILNPYRWLLLAGLLAALYGAHLWRVGAAVKAAEKSTHAHYAAVLAGIAAQTAAAAKEFRAREHKAQAAIEKEATDGQAKIDLARADARRADAAAAGLRQQLDTYRRAAARAAAHPDPAVAGPPAGDALDLLADLFSRAEDAAGELARFADLAHAAGSTCERAYDAARAELSRRHAENP